ncbi:class I SAM-dependent methyltransferase [Roseomonas sp. 18066]|uniref:class I SAM-dependent methyltransferase n=1 Tax=Roseomonas sp. 18066 TaxID=2681412 RepID=UPI001358A319|nr:class I SAM-dependent methyltransferase [Roseomonas sp. 18066]
MLPLLLAPRAGQRPLRRVADLGCGTGIVAELLARQGCAVIAIDRAESRLALARQRLAPYPQAECRSGDAADPPLAPGEVDAIVSRNLLWLLPRPDQALRRWRGLVAPGGRVAAIEASHRHERSWIATLQRRLGAAGRHGGGPLAAAADAGPALACWRQAGLEAARALDLSWVTAVKLHAAGAPLAALLNRSRYYAVLGEAPAGG